MSSNPYEVTTSVEDGVLGVVTGRWEDLLAVARYQRWIIFCMLGYMGSVAAVWFLGGDAAVGWMGPGGADPGMVLFALPFTLLLICSVVAGVISVFLLSIKVHPSQLYGFFLALLVFVPCLGLLILGLISGKATRTLRQNGFQVGFLGADPAAIRRAREESAGAVE